MVVLAEEGASLAKQLLYAAGSVGVFIEKIACLQEQIVHGQKRLASLLNERVVSSVQLIPKAKQVVR